MAKVTNPKGKYIIVSSLKQLPELASSMTLVSIDPGKNNFAISIRTRSARRIRTKVLEKHLIDNTRKRSGSGTICSRIENVQDILNNYKTYYPNTDIALIEEQMYTNNEMIQIYTDVINYFYYLHPHIVIVLVSSRLKSTIIDCDKSVKKAAFQRLEVEKAFELSEERSDDYATKQLTKYQKSKVKTDKVHDLCVTINQEEAFCRLVGYIY